MYRRWPGMGWVETGEPGENVLILGAWARRDVDHRIAL
jgi:hypothetical protein